MQTADEIKENVVIGTPALARSPIMRRLYELAESRGVTVFWYAMPKRFNGMYFRSEGDAPVIVLNPAMRGRLRSFVFAHELGHFALHNGNGISAFETDPARRQVLRQIEDETDEFARRLLHFVRRGIKVGIGKNGGQLGAN